jgi:hypothetical protein
VATVTERFSRGPSQIKPLIAAVITILAMKGMTGDASDPSPVVKKHIRRDPHGGDNADRMSSHIIDAVVALMAFYA